VTAAPIVAVGSPREGRTRPVTVRSEEARLAHAETVRSIAATGGAVFRTPTIARHGVVTCRINAPLRITEIAQNSLEVKDCMYTGRPYTQEE